MRFFFGLVALFGWFLGSCLVAPAGVAERTAFDAPTPAGPVVLTSATRAEMVLNGLWRWLPAAEASEQTPRAAAEWGLIWVPGTWGTQQWGSYRNTEPGSRMPGVQRAGTGAEWEQWNEALQRAWYEREITVPADWAGREIVVNFDRLATDAEVWLGDAKAGRVAWPAGELVLTPHVTPGRTQRLRLLVSAVQTAKEAVDYMGVGQNTATKANLDLRGVTGDVVLSSRPKDARITDVFVKPSTRKNRLVLDLEVAGVKPGAGLRVEAVVTHAADGAPAVVFEAEVQAGAPDAEADPASSAVLRNVGWSWPEARRWDLDDPHLYRIEARIREANTPNDAAPLDGWATTFGFREFWTEGREFYLNGTRLRVRPVLFGEQLGAVPTAATLAADFKRLREHGRNMAEVWPSPKDRGARVQDVAVATAADRAGMLLTVPALRMNEFTNGPGYRPIWNTPAGRDAWAPLYRADWRRLRNHPSIVMMAISGNLGGHDHDQNPRWIGRRAMPETIRKTETFAAQAEADKLAAAFDPTRLRFHHQGGMFGDVFTVNHYLNFAPLQEREEWFSEWAKSGDMPYMGVEFGSPFNATFLRGRAGFGNSITTEPFLAEYAAIYLGAAAYERQGDEYARAVRGRFERADPESNGRWASWQSASALNDSPAFQDIQALFIKHTWRAWRTEGVSGGMIPWQGGYGVNTRGSVRVAQTWRAGERGWFLPEVEASALAESLRDPKAFTLTLAGEAMEAANSATLAWIAGAPGRLHAKDHHLRPGDALEKQFALINDTRAPQPFRLKWRVEALDGAVAERGAANGELAVGETRLLPLRYLDKAAVGAGEKRDLALVLEADIGGRAHADRFAFRIYGAAREDVAPAIVLHDPVGRTAAMLTALGIEHTRFDAAVPLAADALLVLGRESLDDGRAPTDLDAFVSGGGRVLVMAQSPTAMRRHFEMRVAPAPARRLFPVATATDFCSELDETDLRDWNGASTLVEARPDHAAQSGERPAQGWRWGNTGAVSSAMMEKPHRAGWTPLLEGEWDLAYTPLMELGRGKGRLTWCTLDLEDQAMTDAAAERLARRVLAHAARPVATPRVNELLYVGSDAGAAQLRHAGVVFRRAAALDAKAALVVVDAATPLTDAQLETHANRGGTVVMLAQPGGDTPARLGVALKLERRFLGGQTVEANGLTRGLSPSDLRWRAPQDTRVLDAGAQLVAGGLLGARAIGSGRVVFIQFDPTGFELEKRPYFKHTQWRLTRGFVQVLSNLGATFTADRTVFDPQIRRLELGGEWAVKFTRELPVAPWDKPHADPGMSATARDLLADKVATRDWAKFVLPGNHPRFLEVSGEAVWRREVEAPAAWAGEPVVLHIPGIKSFDTVAVNGVVVGSTSRTSDPKNANPWNVPRAYRVPAGVMRAGKNVIAIRQFAPDRDAGVNGRADKFYLQILIPEGRLVQPYVDNWNDDPRYGDDPYRYYRW